MSSILITYNESKTAVYAAIRRYLTAMTERENAGLSKVNMTRTQEIVNGFTTELIPESIAYVTLEQNGTPISVVTNTEYEIIPDEYELNRFKFRIPSGEYFSALIPTEAFDSYSEIEYEAFIKKTYDDMLLKNAIILKDQERKTIQNALAAKMKNFDQLITELQTINN